MIFWISIAIITLILSLLAFYPLLKKSHKNDPQKRDALNKAFYFDRLQEVEQESKEGVIDDPEQTKLELQQSLLEDIPEQSLQTNQASNFNKFWLLILILFVGTLSVGTYLNVGSWFTGTMMEMSNKKLDYFYERLKNEEKDPLTEPELNQFAMGLRVELQKKPDDHALWFMLGQVAIAKDDGQLAFDSFAKAMKLDPSNLQYKISYAQMLMFSNDPTDKAQGKEVLKEIIRQDHTNLDALSMLAFSAFEEEDYKMAATTWGMMLKLMDADDPRKPTIERSVKMAMDMMQNKEQK